MAEHERTSQGIEVEVAAGDATEQLLVSLELPPASTVADAVHAAGLEERMPSLRFSLDAVGIFGKACSPDRVLRAGDRVEVYQDLKADPKVVRRQLAEVERGKKKSS